MMRLTIGRLMIFVAAVAGEMFLFRQLGSFIGPVVGIYLGSGYLAYRRPRRFTRLSLVGVALVALPFAVSAAASQIFLWGARTSLEDSGLLGLALLTWLSFLLASPTLIGWALGWLVANVRRGPGRRAVYQQISVIALVLLPWSMIAAPWPLYAAFAFQVGPMDRLADRIASGGAVTYPVRVGIYRIMGAKCDPADRRNVMFFLDEDREQGSGFARIESSDPQAIRHLDPHVFGHTQMLSESWQSWSYEPDD